MRAQQRLKIAELGVDAAIFFLLFAGHIRQLREDHRIRVRQRVDAHHLAPALARAAHAEVRPDEQQRLDGQVLKFEIPRRMVRGHVADLLHAVLAEPAPGVVVVQIRRARGARAAAAEFAHVVPECRAADERQIDRQPRAAREDGGVQRQIVHADDVRRRVDHARLARQAQQRRDVKAAHAGGKAVILRRHAAVRRRVLGHRQKIGQRVGRAVIKRKQRLQHGKKPCFLAAERPRGVPGVRIQVRRQLRRERGEEAHRVRLRLQRAQRAMGQLRVVPVQRQKRRRDGVLPQRGRQRGAFLFQIHGASPCCS